MRLTVLIATGLAANGLFAATSFTATVVNTVTKARPDGSRDAQTTTAKYFRDALGRTRREQGSSVTIDDPSTGAHIALDTSAKTASVTVARVPGPAPVSTAPVPTARPAPKPAEQLGDQVIEGLNARGFRAEIVIGPGTPGGTIVPKRVVSEMWQSEALGVPILIKTVESFIELTGDRFSSESSMEYKDVVVNAAVSADLFAVPAGYQVKESR
jgi:hypothetical protein